MRRWLIPTFIVASVLVIVCLAVLGKGISLSGTSLTSPVFWLIVTSLAAADSVNPCMISVMVLMIATLAALGLNKKEIVVRATIFTVTVFITYLLLGVLLYFGYTYIYGLSIAVGGFNALKALLVILLVGGGIVNLWDVFSGREPSLAIPKSMRPRVHTLMTYVSILATVLLATFVTLVELPCTGIFYIGLIAYLHSVARSFIHVLPVLIYYCAVFSVPEILITLFAWRGIDPSVLKTWYSRHRRGMRILEGITMIALGVIVWFFVRVG